MAEQGEYVRLTEYEKVAEMQHDRGTLLLVHNNSTHYLAVEVAHDSEDKEKGEVLKTWRYDQANRPSDIYRSALIWMAERAVAWSSSLDESELGDF